MKNLWIFLLGVGLCAGLGAGLVWGLGLGDPAARRPPPPEPPARIVLDGEWLKRAIQSEAAILGLQEQLQRQQAKQQALEQAVEALLERVQLLEWAVRPPDGKRRDIAEVNRED